MARELGQHTLRILSVDWDYFFPIPEYDPGFLYDWGHAENYGEFMLDGIWDIRAGAFVGNKLPLPGTTGMEEGFWSRFNLENCTLFYADSHVNIMRPEVVFEAGEIWSFDAHHDSYTSMRQVTRAKKVSCQDWATGCYLMNVGLKIFYPNWASYKLKSDKPKIPVHIQIDRGQQLRREFNRVFVCRSGAWTPTWIEDKFWRFIEACPTKEKIKLGIIERRHFLASEVDRWIAQTDMLVQKGVAR